MDVHKVHLHKRFYYWIPFIIPQHLWTFQTSGGNQTSSAQNPSFTFNENNGGTFLVTHRVYRNSVKYPGSAGSFAEHSANVVVTTPLPVANYVADDTSIDLDVEGTFEWANGEAVVYTNWNTGEPNNSGSGEDYVELLTNGYWNDHTSTVTRLVVLEFDASSYTYSPTVNYNGSDSFTFIASDTSLLDTGTVFITVTPVNDAPQASNSTVTMNEDIEYIGAFDANDIDFGDILSYSVLTNPSHGTVSLSGCADFIIGSLPYTHQYFNTSASNNWDVSGSDGADIAYQLILTDSTTINVTTCAGFTDYDTKLEIFTADGNCAATSTGNYDDDDPSCTISSVNPTSYASLLSNVTLAEGTYYIVVDGYSGDVGNYQLDVAVSSSRNHNSGAGQFDLAYEMAKLRTDGFMPWEIDEILAQRPDGLTSNNIRTDNGYIYTPEANYNGNDSFTFTANDGLLLDTATVSITITAVNDAPNSFSIIYPVDSSEVSSTLPTLLWNISSDPDPLDTVRYMIEFGSSIPNLESFYTDFFS